jgi:hypothetical protein
MKDHEKQIVYKQIEARRRSIASLSFTEIEALKVHWFDGFEEMPSYAFYSKLCAEERRREVEAASKPKPEFDFKE